MSTTSITRFTIGTIRRGHPADRFGRLKAIQADLAKEEAELKCLLQEYGTPVVSGRLFDVNVTAIEPSEYFDPEKARQLLGENLVAQCMSPKAGTTRFSAKARKARNRPEDAAA